ncbi:MAG: hypothetical protein AB4426_32425 [Xenococcaceae cyanobacterium]
MRTRQQATGNREQGLAALKGKRHLRQQRRAASAGAKPSLKAKGKSWE